MVTDFGGGDHIRLDRSAFADFGAVQGHAQDTAAGVVISLDADNSITLVGRGFRA